MSIGISYLKIRKNPASRILRLRRVALSDIYSSAAVRSCPEGIFMSLEYYGVISYDIKMPPLSAPRGGASH